MSGQTSVPAEEATALKPEATAEKVQTPAVESKQDTPVTPTDTTPPESDKEHVGEQDSITKENFERLSGKVSGLQKDLTTYQQEVEKHNAWVLAKESRTREYLAEQGLSQEEIEERVSEIKRRAPELWATKQEEKKEEPATTDLSNLEKQIEERVTKKLTEKEQAQKLQDFLTQEWKDFITEVPEMGEDNFKDASEEDRKLLNDFALKVSTVANALVQAQPMKYSKALKKAYFLIMEEPTNAAAKEEGVIEGLAQQLANTATTAGESRSSVSSSSGVTLSAEEQNIVSKLGMKAEDYARYKSK